MFDTCSSKFYNSVYLPLVKPQIRLSKSEANVVVGKSVEVICTTVGDPTPNVQWYKLQNDSNGTENKIKTDVNNNLRFAAAQKDDNGTYICEARNVAGIVRKTFNLGVQGKCTTSLTTTAL